jgi:hypothetical protein
MVKQGRIFFILFLMGITILLLPDQGKPVIEFNKMHGPSMSDIIGLTFITIGWLASCFAIIRKWGVIKNRVGEYTIWILLLLYVLSIGEIIVSLKLSIDWLLWPGVIFASLVNILFLVLANNSRNK